MATLTRGIKLSEFSKMSESEKDARVGELFQAALNPTQEQLAQQKQGIDDRIRVFESRYKMSSSEMKRLLTCGELKETADFCSWLMLLKIRGRFEGKFESPRP